MGPAVWIKSLFVFVVFVGILAPLLSWLERKHMAWIEGRVGIDRANVAGLSGNGLLHPLAELIRAATKQDHVPEGAHRFLYRLAPVVALVPAVVALAVIPFGGRYRFGDTVVQGVVADLDTSALFVLAAGLVGAFAILLGGWASGRDESLLGGVRAAGETVSWYAAMGSTLVPMVMIYGTWSLSEMAGAQDAQMQLSAFTRQAWFPELPSAISWIESLGFPAWGVVLQPAAFVLFVAVALFASQGLEASGTGLGGALSRYSGMRLALFSLARWLHAWAVAGLATVVFLGGWSIPFLSQERMIAFVEPWYGVEIATALCLALHIGCFFSKLSLMMGLQVLVRGALPQLRFDQTVALAWKRFLPLCVLNVFATAIGILLLAGAP